jgi:hypothetical protein
MHKVFNIELSMDNEEFSIGIWAVSNFARYILYLLQLSKLFDKDLINCHSSSDALASGHTISHVL